MSVKMTDFMIALRNRGIYNLYLPVFIDIY